MESIAEDAYRKEEQRYFMIGPNITKVENYNFFKSNMKIKRVSKS